MRRRGPSRTADYDVSVVGSGPNGLAAAVLFARAGLRVAVYEAATELGGGARTTELISPGVWHDVCSSAHPMGLASPFMRAFDLSAHGVTMLRPDAAYAHPVDGGRAGVAWNDLDRTVDGLGADGPRWRALLAPLVADWTDVVELAMADLRGPRGLTSTAAVRFGARVAYQSRSMRRTRSDESIAGDMLTGVNLHAAVPPQTLAGTAVGLVLATLAHAVGWPIPRGGSRTIVAALAQDILRHGGELFTDCRVDDVRDLPPSTAVVLNLTPAVIARTARPVLPAPYLRKLSRFRYGPGACKVDLLLSGPVPWLADGCDRAGTLHLVGGREAALAAARTVAAGAHPERPYVLLTQPGVVDDSRAPEGRHTLSAYCHVPLGSDVDVSEAVLDQIERFAPGFRDLVVARHVQTAATLARYNENFSGGDILSGALSLGQLVRRPRPGVAAFSTPVAGLYHCSAATPPGPGVHGMAGFHVARRVLRRHFGLTGDPLRLLRPAAPPEHDSAQPGR
ncbi:phytoene dehydrogenase-like protein [Micromonospora pisi]|uniref:Pyridine nucleotide-disulfide oxidoreductase domain-containing protein 2 n=1 Tax=Micromonospora pisi TaxID=589240 RepID=A0A495JDP5_9ACTN|nr:NAD(P)/FAD-dependent oxidoreductase [Micromonospora pisi]RKR86851.1 phytoene dehydrogenase-like protein [Micromonospora pisi]